MQDKYPYMICDTICGMGITFPQVSKNKPHLHLIQRMRKCKTLIRCELSASGSPSLEVLEDRLEQSGLMEDVPAHSRGVELGSL